MKAGPLVSIIVTTYNLEKYIAACLDSILAQEINFTYEILIGDDCSTDRTTEIVDQYVLKYPERFHFIKRPQNIRINLNMLDLMKKASGKYVALMDGDDLWTDRKKLQLQVDFMEQNPDYSLCFHDADICNGELERIFIFSERHPGIEGPYDLKNIVYKNGYFAPTSSILYRNYPQLFPAWINRYVDGLETMLFFLLGKKGSIKYMPYIMSVYRKHQQSNTAEGKYTKSKLLHTAINNNLLVYQELLYPLHGEYFIKKILFKQIRLLMMRLKGLQFSLLVNEVSRLITYIVYYFKLIILQLVHKITS